MELGSLWWCPVTGQEAETEKREVSSEHQEALLYGKNLIFLISIHILQ